MIQGKELAFYYQCMILNVECREQGRTVNNNKNNEDSSRVKKRIHSLDSFSF